MGKTRKVRQIWEVRLDKRKVRKRPQQSSNNNTKDIEKEKMRDINVERKNHRNRKKSAKFVYYA